LSEIERLAQSSPGGERFEKAGDGAAARLGEARDKFTQMRKTFIWHFVRESLLEQVARGAPLTAPNLPDDPSDSAKATAGRVEERRDALNAFLRSIQATSVDISDLKAGLATKIQALRTADKENGAPPAQSLEEVMVAVGKAQEDLVALEKERAAVDARNQELSERLASASAEGESLARQVKELEREVQADPLQAAMGGSVDSSEEGKGRLLGEVGELEDSEQWFTAVTQVCEQLSGVRVVGFKRQGHSGGSTNDAPSNDEMGAALTVLIWEKYEMKIALQPAPGTEAFALVDAVLHGPTLGHKLPATEDLVSFAKTLPAPNDVQVLVREMATRLRKFPTRIEHVEALKRKYLVDLDGEELTVTMPCGVVVSIRLSPDYPSPSGGGFLLESVVGVGGWRKEEMDAAKAKLTEADVPATDLLGVFSRLESEIL